MSPPTFLASLKRFTTKDDCIPPWAISAPHSSKANTPSKLSKQPLESVHSQGRTPFLGNFSTLIDSAGDQTLDSRRYFGGASSIITQQAAGHRGRLIYRPRSCLDELPDRLADHPRDRSVSGQRDLIERPIVLLFPGSRSAALP